MRTTLILDDDLIAKARELTGVEEKTKLIHMGLEALVQRAAAKRLSALGGTMKNFTVAPRDRSLSVRVAEPSVKYKTSAKRRK